MKRGLLALVLTVALATAALADPVQWFDVRSASGFCEGGQISRPTIHVGRYADPVPSTGQRWLPVLYSRPQTAPRIHLMLGETTKVDRAWPWVMTAVTCLDSRQIMVLAINTRSIETLVLAVRKGVDRDLYMHGAVDHRSVTIKWVPQRTVRGSTITQRVAFPPPPIRPSDPYLQHLLLRQRVVAQVRAIMRRIEHGQSSAAQLTTGPARLSDYYERSKLGRPGLHVSQLSVDERHQVAYLVVSAFFCQGSDDNPFTVVVGYDYQRRRLVEPPDNYRQILSQDCYP